ncbi:MAG: glutathione S-transferase family protein [Plesiomonas sp.]
MYTLHIANKNYSSWSLRPWLLMKVLDIPFNEQLHPFGQGSFSYFSPTQKVPCLYDDSLVVWDSLAIIEYLAETYPTVWPADRKARAWSRSAAAEMHSGFHELRNVCGMNIGVRVVLNTVSAALATDIARINQLWHEGLHQFGGPFLAGKHFSAVDAFFAPVVFRLQTYQLPLSEEARAYCELILSLKETLQWEADALQEVWRDQNHEEDITRVGTIMRDVRLTLS